MIEYFLFIHFLISLFFYENEMENSRFMTIQIKLDLITQDKTRTKNFKEVGNNGCFCKSHEMVFV